MCDDKGRRGRAYSALGDHADEGADGLGGGDASEGDGEEGELHVDDW